MNTSTMTNDQLRNIIENHQRQQAFHLPAYAAALDELQCREGPSLSLDVTIKRILLAAASRSFLSYGDVADANGCAWQAVRRQMPKHLDRVLAKAHARQAPLITSIVVNATNRATGDLEAASLSGFIAGAERLGLRVADPNEFLREQQEATFRFAADHRAL
ncbi:MAG: hypothetical protein REJ23_01265 [Brevundimonas sp.]|nr:hypothetical protein [Brevundimonas sp.]